MEHGTPDRLVSDNGPRSARESSKDLPHSVNLNMSPAPLDIFVKWKVWKCSQDSTLNSLSRAKLSSPDRIPIMALWT